MLRKLMDLIFSGSCEVEDETEFQSFMNIANYFKINCSRSIESIKIVEKTTVISVKTTKSRTIMTSTEPKLEQRKPKTVSFRGAAVKESHVGSNKDHNTLNTVQNSPVAEKPLKRYDLRLKKFAQYKKIDIKQKGDYINEITKKNNVTKRSRPRKMTVDDSSDLHGSSFKDDVVSSKRTIRRRYSVHASAFSSSSQKKEKALPELKSEKDVKLELPIKKVLKRREDNVQMIYQSKRRRLSEAQILADKTESNNEENLDDSMDQTSERKEIMNEPTTIFEGENKENAQIQKCSVKLEKLNMKNNKLDLFRNQSKKKSLEGSEDSGIDLPSPKTSVRNRSSDIVESDSEIGEIVGSSQTACDENDNILLSQVANLEFSKLVKEKEDGEENQKCNEVENESLVADQNIAVKDVEEQTNGSNSPSSTIRQLSTPEYSVPETIDVSTYSGDASYQNDFLYCNQVLPNNIISVENINDYYVNSNNVVQEVPWYDTENAYMNQSLVSYNFYLLLTQKLLKFLIFSHL